MGFVGDLSEGVADDANGDGGNMPAISTMPRAKSEAPKRPMMGWRAQANSAAW